MATAHYDYIYTIYVRHSRSMFDQMMCRIFDIVIDTLICDIIEIIALLIIPTMNTNNAYVYIYIYIYTISVDFDHHRSSGRSGANPASGSTPGPHPTWPWPATCLYRAALYQGIQLLS